MYFENVFPRTKYELTDNVIQGAILTQVLSS